MHAPALHEQFEDFAKQEHAGRLAMWIFLGSEAMLFAALFALYACYRVLYHADFLQAIDHSNLKLGTLNTFILITSSFTVAMAVHAVRAGKNRLATILLVIAIGSLFLVVKGIEYSQHFREGIFPGYYYRDPDLPTYGAKMYFTIYFFTTGLHALHVIIGMGVLTWAMIRTASGVYSPARHLGLELAGLYWHLVDIIWIFLWPLLYLSR